MNNFLIVFVICLLIISFFAGGEVVEAKYCRLRGGDYSYDLGKCFSDEVMK